MSRVPDKVSFKIQDDLILSNLDPQFKKLGFLQGLTTITFNGEKIEKLIEALETLLDLRKEVEND